MSAWRYALTYGSFDSMSNIDRNVWQPWDNLDVSEAYYTRPTIMYFQASNHAIVATL